MKISCKQEAEITAALTQGIWLEDRSSALRDHASGCRFCGDLVLVAQALRKSRARVMHTANLASPGHLWWRAQLRQQNRALQRVTRPVDVAEKFTFLAAIAGLSMLIFGHKTQFAEYLSMSSIWFTEVTGAGRVDSLAKIQPGAWITILMAVALGTFGLFSALLMYWLDEKE